MSEYYDAEEENNLALLESLSESSSEVSRQVNHELIIWASARENLSSLGCEQQRRRLACAV